jgi:hypothetical protein
MIGPDLAAQNEGEITAMVVEDTDKGEVPLTEGDEVVFQGEVVPVRPGGKIKLAGFIKEAGDQFLVLQVTGMAAGRPAKSAVVSQHIEVLPVGQPGRVVPTAVAHASEIADDRLDGTFDHYLVIMPHTCIITGYFPCNQRSGCRQT